jgi:sodium-dependent dicarboxylate transporter 2/3/5
MLKWIKIILGPVLGGLTFLMLNESTEDIDMSITGGVAVWMAAWWITEAIHIYFTALIPITFFPFLGVISMKELAPAYMPEIIFFFVGGFLLAFALEKWNLHRKIALKLLLLFGHTPKRILLGFMFTSYFLSMWILNTAVVMMLLPAALAVLTQISKSSKKESAILKTPILLGMAYAASIGGTATLIGTAPNLYFMDFFNSHYSDLEPVTFASWFLVGFPASLTFFIAAYYFLVWKYFKNQIDLKMDVEYIKQEYQRLGKMTYEQILVAMVFSIAVLLWFTAKDVSIGGLNLKGWTHIFPNPGFIKESTIAMLAAFVLFILPSKNDTGHLLDWNAAKKIPLGMIFLFGGGFAIAKVIGKTGLSNWLGESLEFVSAYPPFLVVIALALFMTFFTELTSNTASTVLMLPILFALASNVDAHPMLIMMPVIMSASFAFMLPVATPPNTIVYATEQIEGKEMARTGLVLNLIGVGISAFFVLIWANWVYQL